MKVVILAGGYGTRLGETTERIPKPMVEVGSRPILWHIMKHFACFGHHEFVLALGYKGHLIKRFFLDYHALNSDLDVDMATGDVGYAQTHRENWRVQLIDTGLDAMTGGRLEAVLPKLDGQRFLLTYGDGVSDVNIDELVAFHEASGAMATVTAVRPPARFGGLLLDGDHVREFSEKPQIGEGWINGGFMVVEPDIADYLDGPGTILEVDALERIAADGKLAAFRHTRFWQCMDTPREVELLNRRWAERDAPWKLWHD